MNTSPEKRDLQSGNGSFQKLIDSLNVGVLLQGSSAEILAANPAALDLLGLNEEQLLGKSSFDPDWKVVHADNSPYPGETHPVPVAIQTGQPVLNEVMGVFRPRIGDWVWLLVNAIPERAEDGSMFVICTFTDITQLRKTEDALRESEERYRKLVELSPYGIALHADGIFKYVNPALLKLLDYEKAEELIGTKVIERVAPGFRDAVRARFEKLSRMDHVPLADEKMLRRDGSEVDVEIAAMPMFLNGRPAVQAMVNDITVKKEAEKALAKSEERYRRLVENASDGIFLVDNTGQIIDTNQAGSKMLGYSREEILSANLKDLITEDNLLSSPFKFSELLSKQHLVFERKLKKKDGSWLPAEISAVSVMDGSFVIGIVRDISIRKTLEEARRDTEDRLRVILESVPDIITSVDREGRIESINRTLGRPEDDVIGKTTFEFIRPEYVPMVRERLERAFESGESAEYELFGEGKVGEERMYSTRLIPLSREGKVFSVLLVSQDVTKRRQDEQKLAHQATHDSLTDLPNRQSLLDHLSSLISASGESSMAGLLLLDLDRFKEINDTLGHFTGDLLLKKIGPRLATYLESVNAWQARLGGDEFAILVPNIRDTAELESIAESIHQLIREPFPLEGMNLELDASIGIAVYPLHGKDPVSLLRCADVAMYLAKKRSSGVAFYAPAQDTYSRRRLTLLGELGAAIREDQLELHYQPKFRITDRKCIGFEALVRWNHPTIGKIPPGEFIPLAEMGNLIIPLTNWVVEQSIIQWKKWNEQGLKSPIAVNLSVRNLLDEQYPTIVDSLLQRHGVPKSALELEITESTLMIDPERSRAVLGRLNSLGLTLSIDDYGAGYSSLAYLSNLPVKSLKIDLQFIINLKDNERNRVIVASTVQMAHNLGLSVVAEGVEDAVSLNLLRDMKCDMAQGFYLSRPLPSDQIDPSIF